MAGSTWVTLSIVMAMYWAGAKRNLNNAPTGRTSEKCCRELSPITNKSCNTFQAKPNLAGWEKALRKWHVFSKCSNPQNAASQLLPLAWVAVLDELPKSQKKTHQHTNYAKSSLHRTIWVFPKIGVPPNHPILIGFSVINHPFWGTPILETPI